MKSYLLNFFLRDNQYLHIYKYVQSHNIILDQHVSVTPVTITGCLITRLQSV